ncbi:MAG TPA: M15 family metallopeptidase [Acidimicrobiia bacterium]|nr:M15 family metallopeptidase [Acidimicrobiia bacterium]
MRSRWSLAAIVAGILIGYTLPVALTSSGPPVSASVTSPNPTRAASIPTSTLARIETKTVPTTAATSSGSGVFLVWATGGLPRALVDGLAANFEEISIVKADAVELSSGGRLIPLDALALDPKAHAFYDRSAELGRLDPGTVALGETSARLRDAALGSTLHLDGIDFAVAAFVSDELIGAAEVVFAIEDPLSPVSTDRYALIRSHMARQDLENLVRGLYQGPAPLRIRTEGETPWLRHGDAVLPQVFIKEALGEFSYTDVGGTTFDQDQTFIAKNIVTERVPLLGEVRCHRRLVEMLTGAMASLIDRGLAHLVEPAGFAGCWFPRFISPTVGVSSGLSRHAWGAAVDLNAGSNPVGSSGNQDLRLIKTMERFGLTWGGDWLVPDPMHFEFATQR